MTKTLRIDENTLAAIASISSFLAVAVLAVTVFLPARTQDFSEDGSNNDNILVVRDDYGGYLDTYIRRWQVLAQMGFNIVIDGPCASACTEILSEIPSDRVCVTTRAAFGFHQASTNGAPDLAATAYMYAGYPKVVRDWIDANGPLTTDMIYMTVEDLKGYYPFCRRDRSDGRP